jgi:hypothetical protein
MTGLDRPVKRETRVIDFRRRKPLVILLQEGGRLVRIKVKGERQWYTVTIEQIFQLGCQNRAVELRAEKLARRQQRRRA